MFGQILARQGVTMRERGLFDEMKRLEELTELDDPLLILEKKIKWESFRDLLNKIRPEENPSNIKNAGRKPFNVVIGNFRGVNEAIFT